MPSSIPKSSALTLLAKIPSIPARARELSELYTRLRAFLNRSPRTRLPAVLKYAAYIVLLLNLGSLPFVWHIRVFWPIFAPRIEYWLLCLKLVFASREERARACIAWGENLSPVGANPFEFSTVCKRWASIDDIDVFGHLSNSSYAKAFDSVRAKACVKWFPAWGRSGGQMALGATYYHFIREIPPLVRYEVRVTIGSWDHKWLYVVARYVTRPRRRHAHDQTESTGTPLVPTSPGDAPSSAQNGTAHVEDAIAALLHPDAAPNGTVTVTGTGTGTGTGTSTPRRAPIVEPDGALLHCVAVSQLCFKWGRLTVPPAVVLASDGFTKPYCEAEGEGINDPIKGAYSRTHPPPNWLNSQSLRVPPQGSMDDFRAFLGGGWRDVPDGERWWEDALNGSIEARRQANLEILDTLRQALEQARSVR